MTLSLEDGEVLLHCQLRSVFLRLSFFHLVKQKPSFYFVTYWLLTDKRFAEFYVLPFAVTYFLLHAFSPSFFPKPQLGLCAQEHQGMHPPLSTGRLFKYLKTLSTSSLNLIFSRTNIPRTGGILSSCPANRIQLHSVYLIFFTHQCFKHLFN